MLKGFKDFLLKGNVLDLAVAVVVGAAFTAIVTAFTDHIVQPLIASIGGGKDVQGLAWQIRPGVPATTVDLGAVITAGINFILVAAVVYFVLILPYETLKNRAGTAATEDEVDVLVEIRDLLASQAGTPQGGAHAALPPTGQFPTQPKQ
ncbi:Large-conductance mechanosensitive channel OS=Tsukamurella paurometabola (strain ATCC 8368 / DSM/ CCUG 35730 / CIP 100753 / JCM 10117 / KCTC 9821 / NBRC 16120 / NCIMB 702349 / NCTC 13040) OX=521096 GN=mscL PE=3 SV=1 [Tsukamurella paurometabola]|uniref:Large-conductance mechanosensitive channel n=1 Tax=Tsukamurella paurometabola (strain ATCC 8368 / DSM 20162 / CCUG 35730 / CIP 100753 / JCM 10117 / KCTC 9821 / NBRC 16120 / NCIMB 702349 / NCTC 13040) TaxID=521096 RepID=D5UVT0_TSUPD|nr:large conductance mechanosensitive channel protein MscL [Tsukamurella paurometabola]ADG79862.1 large conductance mechanosensitive channel protein [Tsukamurella paurometabola DSM 20162]SUP37457.1 Large-conductance mechanosensitive channel [Tsukamurella paurometabola]